MVSLLPILVMTMLAVGLLLVLLLPADFRKIFTRPPTSATGCSYDLWDWWLC